MRESFCATPTLSVAEMYEDLPYPYRDPVDETPGQPYAIDVPSTPAAISHHLRGGALDYAVLGRPFRILVAGGGTGDATVMAAVSFHMAMIPLQIVHRDLSAASIAIARQRVERHNLSSSIQVTFQQGSLLEVAVKKGEEFDFINAVGVIHHLKSPVDGLRALRKVLRAEGGLFMMVYGALGRTGVYDIQDMWRLSNISRREFLNGPVQDLLKTLPETNWLARNRRMMTQKVKQGDATTISDLLVHSCDHAYTVASLLELLAEADLELLGFADPAKYRVPKEARSAVDPLLAGMQDEWQRFHFAELLKGDIFLHSYWVGPAPAAVSRALAKKASGNDAGSVVQLSSVLCPSWYSVGMRLLLPAEDKANILLDAPVPGIDVRDGLPPATCSLYLDHVEHTELPCVAVALLEQLDCQRSVVELHIWLAAQLSSARPQLPALSQADGLRLVQELYGNWSTIGERKLFVLQRPLKFRGGVPTREKKVVRILVRRDWDSMTTKEPTKAPGSSAAAARMREGERTDEEQEL